MNLSSTVRRVMITAGAIVLGAQLLVACGTTVPLTRDVAGAQGADGLGTGVGPAPGLGSVGERPSSPSVGGSTASQAHAPESTGSPGGRSGFPTEAPGAVPSAAAVSGPITIGVLAAGDFSGAASSAGFNSGTTTSGEAAMKAVVRHYETHGGLAGRPLRAVVSVVPPTTTNYNSALAAECARFTQDHNVAAVVSNIGYYNASFELCLQAKNKPHFEGGWGLTDEVDLRRFPGYYVPNMPSYDARFAALLASGTASGHLARGDKVGVVVEDCPHIQRAFAAEWKPRARRAGLVLDEFTTKCITGAGDAPTLTQEMQAAQFRFRTNGVKTVMFATYPTEVNLLFFAQAAQSQRWYPRYYLDSKSRVAHEHSTGNYPADQVKNMKGVGWTPALDITNPKLTSPAQKRCLQIMNDAQINVTNGLDAELAFSACDPFFLLETALKTARGAAEPTVLRQAVESLGSSFAAAGNGGTTVLSPRQHSGSSQYATFAYTASCDCIRYTSGFRSWR